MGTMQKTAAGAAPPLSTAAAPHPGPLPVLDYATCEIKISGSHGARGKEERRGFGPRADARGYTLSPASQAFEEAKMFYSVPLVLGTALAAAGSREMAWRNALAVALKMASAMW